MVWIPYVEWCVIILYRKESMVEGDDRMMIDDVVVVVVSGFA